MIMFTWSEEMIYSLAIAFTLIILDYITGIVKAVCNKNLSSSKMREGLWHKCGFVLAICLAWVVEMGTQHVQLPFTLPVLVAVCTYITITEITSIIENLGAINPELQSSKFLEIFEDSPNTAHKKEDK